MTVISQSLYQILQNVETHASYNDVLSSTMPMCSPILIYVNRDPLVCYRGTPALYSEYHWNREKLCGILQPINVIYKKYVVSSHEFPSLQPLVENNRT